MMKSHRIKSAITGFIALMGIATAAYAQSAAEIGAMHNNCNHPNYQGDRSRCGGGNRAPVSAEVWENRFGALALDPSNGNLFSIEGETSKRRAINAAHKKCGKKDCIVGINIRNGCIASSWGGGKYFWTGHEDKKAAEDQAMQECRAARDGCELMYSGCSLPVRVK